MKKIIFSLCLIFACILVAICGNVIYWVIKTPASTWELLFSREVRQSVREANRRAAVSPVPHLLFNYPLVVGDMTASFKDNYLQNHTDRSAKILIFPIYYDSHVYRNRVPAKNIYVGEPSIISASKDESFGETLQKTNPKMLEAEAFLFFVKGCSPVIAGVYFPLKCKEDPTTRNSIQILGVYRLPESQLQRLNEIMYRELSDISSPLYLKDGAYYFPFEEAIKSNLFFSYQAVRWPVECINTMYQAVGEVPPSNAHVRSMMDWGLSGHSNVVYKNYSSNALKMLKEFLDDHSN